MEKGPVSFDEMVRTFNMGIGMVMIVPKACANDALHHLKLAQEKARIIGEIVPSDGGPKCQVTT
jgi:phosphoribosylformylglycinamidine cyclo-ligase